MMMWPRTMLLGSSRVAGRTAAQRPWGVHTGALCMSRAVAQRPTSVVGLAKRVGATQFYATSSKDQQPENEPPDSTGLLDRVVDRLNASIKKYPGDTIVTLFAFDIGSIAAMYGLLSVSGIEFSPEFALAFATSRPFRRFRLPLDLAAAAAVSKVFPAFSRVRLSDLAGVLPTRPGAPVASSTSSNSLLARTMDKAKDVIDTYGAAYMMGSRLAGVGVVSVLYVLIKQGVDVMPLLAQLGVEGVGTALGSYAAAVVFSSVLYPVTLGAAGYVVPVLAKARNSVMP